MAGSCSTESRSESTPAARTPRTGTRYASDQNRTRDGLSANGMAFATARTGASPSASTAPVRAASRCAVITRRAGASDGPPFETTFCDARRKNSLRTR